MSATPHTHPLPSTAELLVSGGDSRIALDPATGASIYGSRPQPDPELVAFGSSTASLISVSGLAAAEALRERLDAELRQRPPQVVYAEHAAVIRDDLLACCGLHPRDGVHAILAASGTDLFLLATQWLRPQRAVTIVATDTGSGVGTALQGRHFNGRAACAASVPSGAQVSDWQGEVVALAVRGADGNARSAASIDADCVAGVSAAAQAGQRVLLVLTDSSKTGLIVPSVDTALALKRQWPQAVEVLVDACQFRLAPATLRAYLAQGCMVAVTGSKFMAGPTFCGALLIPPQVAARYRDTGLPAGVAAYSTAADWPQGWAAAGALPDGANFGLLLRWRATLAEMAPFLALPEQEVANFLHRFGPPVRARLLHDNCFEPVPVPAPSRGALGQHAGWDSMQTIFPFLIYVPDGLGARRPLTRAEAAQLHQDLRVPQDGGSPRRFQLGQPVPCGERDGVPVSALRLCLSAPLVVAACRDGRADAVMADAMACLDEIARRMSALGVKQAARSEGAACAIVQP